MGQKGNEVAETSCCNLALLFYKQNFIVKSVLTTSSFSLSVKKSPFALQNVTWEADLLQ